MEKLETTKLNNRITDKGIAVCTRYHCLAQGKGGKRGGG
jgi:hypothetical protein